MLVSSTEVNFPSLKDHKKGINQKVTLVPYQPRYLFQFCNNQKPKQGFLKKHRLCNWEFTNLNKMIGSNYI